MAVDIIEGTAVDVTEPRDIVPFEARPVVRLASQQTPEEMIALASRMATALKDIVERQRLYAVISGKKYPQVEAWMTIGRMDNVVAREAEAPIRREDGSYEAFVELIRLGDGAIIGRASALCGTSDDKPWNGRSEPARRSMAVTRATSRAFRQQYSWIMALAGYEPTPVEEMPVEGRHEPARITESAPTAFDAGLVGIAQTGKGDADFELRQEAKHGHKLVFRLVEGRKGFKVVALGVLAEMVAEYREAIENQRVTCWGAFEDKSFTPAGKDTAVTYQELLLQRLRVGTLDLTPPDVDDGPPVAVVEPDGFDDGWLGKVPA